MYRLFITALACASLLLAPITAYAQLDDAYVLRVRDRCSLVKNLLEQQRRHDLVARINIGRDYQNSIAQQQALLARLRNNKFGSEQFDVQTKLVEVELNNLRGTGGAYNAYDDALGELLGIDCAQEPLDFINQLDETRARRAAVQQQIERINLTLARYREMVVNLQVEIERVQNAVLGEAL